MDTKEPKDHAVNVSMRYAGKNYRANALVKKLTLARDFTRDRLSRNGGCDWDNLHVLNYIRLNEHLDARRLRSFPVEGQVMGVTRNGKLDARIYGAWNMRNKQRGQQVVYCAHIPTNMRYRRDKDERDCVNRLSRFIRDPDEKSLLSPGTLSE